MVRLGERFNPQADFDLLVKLEGMNPFGSIKDRTAHFMLKGLQLAKEQSLVEPSAGNTGIALAALANAQDTPIEIAVPDGAPEEKKALLKLLGAELIEVEDELCPIFPSEGARGVVKSMVESEAYGGKYVSPNQYESELNVAAHYHTTGPEIWRQTGGRIDYFFAGIGTGGTITGVGRYLKERNPKIRIIGIEPASRHHKLSGLKRVTGLPDEYFPKILDRDVVDELISVTDDDAFGRHPGRTQRRRARRTHDRRAAARRNRMGCHPSRDRGRYFGAIVRPSTCPPTPSIYRAATIRPNSSTLSQSVNSLTVGRVSRAFRHPHDEANHLSCRQSRSRG